MVDDHVLHMRRKTRATRGIFADNVYHVVAESCAGHEAAAFAQELSLEVVLLKVDVEELNEVETRSDE